MALAKYRSRSSLRQRHVSTSITTLLMMSTSVSDVINGIVVMPLVVYEITTWGVWNLGQGLCNVKLLVSNIVYAVSAYHVCCLAVDRYLAVCWPLLHRRLTSRTAAYMILASWFVPIAYNLTCEYAGLNHQGVEYLTQCVEMLHMCYPVYNTYTMLTTCIVSFTVPFIIAYVLYGCITVQVWKFNKRKIQKQEKQNSKIEAFGNAISTISAPESNILDTTTEESNLTLTKYNIVVSKIKSPQNITTNRDSSRNFKAVFTIGSIVIVYTICWLPAWVFSIFFANSTTVFPYWVVVGITLFGYGSLSLNPMLYCFNGSVRRAVRSLLCHS
ncbi:beta-1 adrenergic receptor-like [Physella acuta]|uniref:beta-1 adrenergic receptor-like n=1 Tax=Physella acuta TaxID=109671 RepID=UPI0027DABFBA|nr:beta-1 adrenergic receptor-like [Physella acuta]